MSVNSLLWGIVILLLANMVLSGTIVAQMRRITRNQRREHMATEDVKQALASLQAEVAADTDAVNSANTLILGLEDQLKNIPLPPTTDPETVAAIETLRTALADDRAKLAAAVAANTPAAPPAPPADQGTGDQPQT